MPVQSWHVGKIVIVWIIAASITAYWIMEDVGFMVVPAALVVGSVAVTWAWLGGRESQ